MIQCKNVVDDVQEIDFIYHCCTPSPPTCEGLACTAAAVQGDALDARLKGETGNFSGLFTRARLARLVQVAETSAFGKTGKGAICYHAHDDGLVAHVLSSSLAALTSRISLHSYLAGNTSAD